MSRFFFSLYQRTNVTPDEEGRQFDDAEAIRRAALRDARSILAADVEAGILDLTGRIEVTDEDGEVVLTLPFKEAVERLD